MAKITLPQKDPNATIGEVFDFTSFILSTDTISSAVCTCTVYSGVDASPSSVLSGSTSISGFQVTQYVTGGVNGVIYILTCKATCASGAILTLTGYLAVLQDAL